MKELIDQFWFDCTPSLSTSYYTAIVLSYHRPFVMDRTDKYVYIMDGWIDLGILFYFISIIIVKSRRLERAQGPF
jgi:hypothetical protein